MDYPSKGSRWPTFYLLSVSIENSDPKSDQWYLDWFVGENLNRKPMGFDHQM